jgi:protocatechuate 3,4-dioxygenase beta subunit
MNARQTENQQLNDGEVEDDDRPVGRVLSRREVLALLGGGSAIFLGAMHALAAETVYLPIIANGGVTPTATLVPTAVAGTTTPTPTATATSALTPTPSPTSVCVVRPEMTVGPYFVDEKLNRADIRGDRTGTELQLTLRVYSVGSSCTPLVGAFVDIWHCDAAGLYSDVAAEGTAGQTFLRGYQVTDSNGVVNFTTIYPGWYTSRAVHIHFKIRDALTTNPTQ